MGEFNHIYVPRSADDHEGAIRTFKDFTRLYAGLIEQVSQHLDASLQEVPAQVAEAYMPWQNALKDLLQGSVAIAHKMKPKNPEAFFEALQIFSLDSAVQFIRDLCLSCKIRLGQEWDTLFKEQINTLLFAYSIVMRKQQQQSIVR